MFKKIKRYIKDPYYSIGYCIIDICPKLMSDKYYLSILWKMCMDYKIEWKNPKTLNEKLQWLKLYDRNPLYTTLVDKYRVKQWVTDTIGEQYVIPTLAVYNTVDEIDLAKLPDQFVLKCNHDSGSVVICRDKSKFDLEAAKKKLEKGLKRNFYWEAREWPYKNVKRCVFAEKYIQDFEDGGLVDYKFFCFDGMVDCVMLCLDRHIKQPKFYFFDRNWNLKRMNIRGKEAPDNFTIPKPKEVDKMFELASILSKGIPFVRVDLYDVAGDIQFGEMTFYPDGGLDSNILPETDLYFGSLMRTGSK